MASKIVLINTIVLIVLIMLIIVLIWATMGFATNNCFFLTKDKSYIGNTWTWRSNLDLLSTMHHCDTAGPHLSWSQTIVLHVENTSFAHRSVKIKDIIKMLHKLETIRFYNVVPYTNCNYKLKSLQKKERCNLANCM